MCQCGLRTHTHTHIRTHTQTHTRIHTYARTHIHTRIRTCSVVPMDWSDVVVCAGWPDSVPQDPFHHFGCPVVAVARQGFAPGPQTQSQLASVGKSREQTWLLISGQKKDEIALVCMCAGVQVCLCMCVRVIQVHATESKRQKKTQRSIRVEAVTRGRCSTSAQVQETTALAPRFCSALICLSQNPTQQEQDGFSCRLKKS